jgi:hypothetical protein
MVDQRRAVVHFAGRAILSISARVIRLAGRAADEFVADLSVRAANIIVAFGRLDTRRREHGDGENR